MLRKATEDDFLDLIALRCDVSGCTRTVAADWIRKIIGIGNFLILEKTTKYGKKFCAAMLAAVPVHIGYRHGVWLSGFGTKSELRKQGIMTKLVSDCMRAYAANGFDFAITTPNNPQMVQWIEKLEFLPSFPLRTVNREIKHNLLAQAQFDTMTVHRLMQARHDFQPNCIELPEECMNNIISQLYTEGITLVSNQRGYGLYYEQGDRLLFIELQAESDYAAENMLQAVREKTGIEKAEITLTESQTLFQGEGKRRGYGWFRFLRQPFPLDDIYFQLLL